MALPRAPLGAALLLVLAALAFGLLHAAPTGAATCDRSWDGEASDNNWSTATNWTGNAVPGAGEKVCITATGTYTVTVAGAVPAIAGLTLGSSSGTQTVELQGGVSGFSQLTLTDQGNGSDGVQEHGVIRLRGVSGTDHSQLSITGGTLANAGTIDVDPRFSGGGQQVVTGSINNSGTLSFDATTDSGGGTWTNSGTLSVANGATVTRIDAGGGVAFTQAGGTVTNNGTFTQAGGAASFNAGTATGNPIVVAGVSLAPGGTGSGTIRVSGGSASTLASDVGAGYTVTIAGTASNNTELDVNANRTNNGVIRLEGISGTGHSYLKIASGMTLANAGTLDVNPRFSGGSPQFLDGAIDNTGTLTIDADTTVGVGALTNSGAFSVASDVFLTRGGGSSFSQLSGGTTTVSGVYTQGGTWTQTGGTTTLVTVAGAGAPGTLQTNATLSGGTLTGIGRIQGNLANNGATVSPGSAATTGTLTVDGTYTQQASGVLAARVRPAGADRVSAGGVATAAGTLALSTSGFQPAEGQTFTVLSGSSRTGTFGTVTGANSGPYDVVYDATTVKLLTKALPPTDLPPGTSVSIDSPSLRNPAGDGLLTFTVKLSQPSLNPVNVNFATADGTAKAPGDYGPGSGTLSFAPGETEKPVTVLVRGTSAAGADRTLFVNLTSISGASLAQGKGTILNDRVALDSVAPGAGGMGEVTLALHGAGFTRTPTAKLRRDGQPDIVASAVVPGADGQTLEATFNTAGAAAGKWNVVAELPSFDASATLPDAFTVETTRAPSVKVELKGRRAALDGYPWIGRLHVTNTGNLDATNTLLRITGFHSGAKVDVVGRGTSQVDLDSGVRHDVVIAVDRVPAGSSRDVRIQFTPVGPAHSFYRLQPSVVSSSSPDGGPAKDPTAKVTAEVKSESNTNVSGVIHASGDSVNGDVSFSATFDPAGKSQPPSVEKTESGGRARYVLKGSITGPATGPPPRTAPASGGTVELVFEGDVAVLKYIAETEGSLASYRLAAHRRLIAAYMRTQGYISKDQDVVLGEVAEGLTLAEQWSEGAILRAYVEISHFPEGNVWQGVFNLRWGDAARRVNEKYARKNSPYVDPEYIWSDQDPAIRLQVKPPKPTPTAPQPPPLPVWDYVEPPPPPPAVIEVRASNDPNDKVGPPGSGKKHYVAADEPLSYDVQFENLPTASAPAHEVTVTDQLDPGKVDLSTLSLGTVYFGDKFVTPPPGLQTWRGTVDLRPAKNLIVAIDGNLDSQTGLLTWHFRGLDPATGELELDPDLGFLPPDKTPPEGQGGVSFAVSPKAGLKHGAQIANGATIVFDRNAPISTPVFTNTIDTSEPSSRVRSAKPSRGSCRSLKVAWAGKDTGAGVAFHDLYVARNGARYRLWRYHSKSKSATYQALADGAYAFASLATDGAGHVEPAGLWDILVKSAVKRGKRLVISLNTKAATALKITSLNVLVNGRRKASVKMVPSKITLNGLSTGGYAIDLVAQAKSGKKRVTVRGSRTIAMCPKAPKKR